MRYLISFLASIIVIYAIIFSSDLMRALEIRIEYLEDIIIQQELERQYPSNDLPESLFEIDTYSVSEA